MNLLRLPLIREVILTSLIVSMTSCQLTQCQLEPTIVYSPPTGRISDLPSAFPPLTSEERQQRWAEELLIGEAFGREWDFYRAITSYKSALVLIPESYLERRLQIEYSILLCYFLGKKYQEVVNLFEHGPLLYVNPLFPAYNQILLMLYESYIKVDQTEKADCLLEVINKYSEETAVDLSLYKHLMKGEVACAQAEIEQHKDFATMQPDLDTYYQYRKSPRFARQLNAIIPGAGYYYVGQKTSALTALLINTLFTFAAVQFFRKGYVAAGVITASMEAGWYIGGINGAGIEAQVFNNRLYEGVSKKIMSDHFIFPVLMFETSF